MSQLRSVLIILAFNAIAVCVVLYFATPTQIECPPPRHEGMLVWCWLGVVFVDFVVAVFVCSSYLLLLLLFVIFGCIYCFVTFFGRNMYNKKEGNFYVCDYWCIRWYGKVTFHHHYHHSSLLLFIISATIIIITIVIIINKIRETNFYIEHLHIPWN